MPLKAAEVAVAVGVEVAAVDVDGGVPQGGRGVERNSPGVDVCLPEKALLPPMVRTPGPAAVSVPLPRRAELIAAFWFVVIVRAAGSAAEVERAAGEGVAAAVKGDVADGLGVVDGDGGRAAGVEVGVGAGGRRGAPVPGSRGRPVGLARGVPYPAGRRGPIIRGRLGGRVEAEIAAAMRNVQTNNETERRIDMADLSKKR